MRLIKLLGLAFMATLAFSAIGALGAGSASALLFLTSGGASTTFTVLNLNTSTKPAVLETKGGQKVECEGVVGSGTILNKTDLSHKIVFTFHKCKASFGSTCSSAGEPSGLIKTLSLRGLLVTLLNGKYGIETVSEKGTTGDLAEFKCSGLIGEVTTVVTGSVVGEFTETKAESEVLKKEAKVEFAKGVNAGEAKIKDYWTLEGVVSATLTSKLSGAVVETAESNEQAVGDVSPAVEVKFCHG